jgi:signal transduction histidine kinase
MIFRIIQEQVNNVLRHSGARNLLIELTLEETTGRIELNMTDDGKGFNPEKVRKKGLGLSNIRSRADLWRKGNDPIRPWPWLQTKSTSPVPTKL